MKEENRKVIFDKDLQLEACFFHGISQPFPPHFHEYYVIGFIESGRRSLSVCGEKFTAETGDVLLFNPGENHFCCGLDSNTLTYGAFNIKPDIIQKLSAGLTGNRASVRFSENLIRDGDLFLSLKKLHETVMRTKTEAAGFGKEELFLLTFSELIGEYSEQCENILLQHSVPECREEIEKACLYINENFSDRVTLDKLCKITALSRAALVRAFAKEKGITPYRYLENIRLNAAKRLLEQGESPVDAALKTGFSDQSHFTNFFKAYIGLTPKQYGNIFKTR